MNCRVRVIATVGAVTAVVLASGCSGGTTPAVTETATVTVTAPPPKEDPSLSSLSPTPSPTADTTAVLAAYFEPFGKRDPRAMESMRQYASPGSPADLYAIHQTAAENAVQAAGGRSDEEKVTVSEDKVTMTGTNVLTGETDTSVFQDFEYDADGRLVSWTVEGSGPLAGRIAPVKGSVSSDGVKVQLQTAYVTNGGDLAITLKVTNRADVAAQVRITDYLDQDGRQTTPTVQPSLLDPRPGAFMEAFITVPRGKIGGTLFVEFAYDNTQELVVD